MHPHPQNAEQVVDHPHRPTQQQRLTQRPALLQHINGHPASSRASRPPLPRLSSP